jgi:hypothetical protein
MAEIAMCHKDNSPRGRRHIGEDWAAYPIKQNGTLSARCDHLLTDFNCVGQRVMNNLGGTYVVNEFSVQRWGELLDHRVLQHRVRPFFTALAYMAYMEAITCKRILDMRSSVQNQTPWVSPRPFRV